MKMRYIIWAIIIGLAGGGALRAAATQPAAPRVTVNGVVLAAPVQVVDGSILVPMRAVFEALQAQVEWLPAERKIVATREQTTITLWLDRKTAMINDYEVSLSVPPTLFADATYVPLRFPAEAFGGDVQWLSDQRMAVISLKPSAATASASITGVLSSLEATDAGPTLLLKNLQNNDIKAIAVLMTAAITRNRDTADLEKLLPGDLVTATLDTAGKATAIAASSQQVQGTVAGMTATKILLQDGTLYQVGAQAQIVDTDGNPLVLADVQRGGDVTLRITPGTTTVWSVIVSGARTAHVENLVDEPVIDSVSAGNYTRPLREGDTLTIQTTGTPGADEVTARIGEALTGIKLVEHTPGKYSAQVTIGPKVPAVAEVITVTMRKGGQLCAGESAKPVVIDETAPVCRTLDPGPDTPLFDPNPSIDAEYGDDGSGVDPASVHLLVNGRDVTDHAKFTDHDLHYNAEGLPMGATKFRLEFADRAGNLTVHEWKVDVRAPQEKDRGPEIYTVGHDATRPLRRGDQLIIRVSATPHADRVTARVGDAITGIDLDEREPGRYSARLDIDKDVEVKDAAVYVELREGDITRKAQSTQKVTIDTRPPRFTQVTPNLTETFDRVLALQAAFSDDDSGIDPDSVRLLVNGRDCTQLIKMTDQGMSYTAQELPYGTSRFHLECADEAGNVAVQEWEVVVRERPPLIRKVEHDARGPLRREDKLNIRVYGTPDADSATAHIGNAITDIRLDERQPGIYTAQIIIRGNVHASSVPVYAVLRRHGIDSDEVASDLRVTIDTESPDCDSVNPRRDANVANLAPEIGATYHDDGAGIARDRVKLLINGQDVTAQANIGDRQISYPGRGLPLGPVRVKLMLVDKVGNETPVEWQFTLQAPPAIISVSHDANNPVKPGQTVTLTARLSTKPQAMEWRLDDRVISQENNGDAAGAYRATYTIKRDDPVGKHQVSLHCTVEGERSETVTAPNGLTIAALPVKDFAITSPADKSKAPDSLTVTGVAPVGAEVRVTVSERHMLIKDEKEIATITTKSDADGLWSTTAVNLPDVKGLSLYTVKAELLDEHGTVVKTATMTLQKK